MLNVNLTDSKCCALVEDYTDDDTDGVRIQSRKVIGKIDQDTDTTFPKSIETLKVSVKP